jgi:tRNA threonylcarbamoyladenosine biosynthesis protein TsaB
LQIENGIIVPMIDARRMEVYSAIFNAKKEMIREVQAEILTDSSFSDIEDAVYFVGDSNEKAKTILSKSNFNFVDTIFYPSAQEMSAISYKKFLNNSFEDVAYFEPYYLKDFMLQTKST